MSERILERYKTEENSLWGLYNAITFVASHNATIPTMNGLLNKSANLLEKELMVKA